MAYRAVQSDHVQGYDYDEKAKKLRVVFNDGSEWDYSDVPQSVADGMMTTPSVGRYMHKNIKPMFQARRAR